MRHVSKRVFETALVATTNLRFNHGRGQLLRVQIPLQHMTGDQFGIGSGSKVSREVRLGWPHVIAYPLP